MARPLRIEFPGALYHVTSRGDRREEIFADDTDRLALLDVVGRALERFDASAVAWCLMGNHFHFVLVTRQPNLSQLMRQINGVYTQRFNHRHAKVGHLFQGRFKAVLVDRDHQLLEVCRYVELNPVRAGLADDPARWGWSSYDANAGYAVPPKWLDTRLVWEHVLGRDVHTAADARLAAQRYRALVAAGRDVDLWAPGLRQQVYLGDEEFVERMQALADPHRKASREVPRRQRAVPLTLSQWLARCAERDEAIARAHRESHLSMSAIARELGLSVSRISRIVDAHEQATRQARDKT